MNTTAVSHREVTALSDSDKVKQIEMFQAVLRDIGMARFVGRINAGVIPSEVGLEVINAFVSAEERRPFVSRLAHSVLGRRDSFHF